VETKTDGAGTQRSTGSQPTMIQRSVGAAQVPGAGQRGRSGGKLPAQGGSELGVFPAAYVSDSFTGDIAATMGGTPAFAHDGEPAGLARVTLAMRPAAQKIPPAPRRLVGLALWAAALGILGVMLGIRDLIGLFTTAPSWFLPEVSVVAVIGVALTMGAFLTARARIVPWVLLGLATCALGANVVAAMNAF
jgi:hypothetical protein